MANDRVPGSDVATLRRLNTRSILLELTNNPNHRFTVSELADLTQLSRPTVSVALSSLVSDGWAAPVGEDSVDRSAGRPARHFRFMREAGVCIGVDAGPHSVTALVADLANEVVSKKRTEFKDLCDPAVAIDAIDRTVTEALAALGAAPPVLGLSVAVPGVVDRTGKLRQSVVVPQWAGGDLAGELSRRYPKAVVALGNDVKLATVAELRAREHASTRDFLYLSIGRRISTGIVMDGSVREGATGSAGELGASPAVAWAGAIESAVRDDPRTLTSIARDAGSGEAVAVGIVESIARSIGEGLALLVLAVDPQVIVLAGPMTQAGECLARPLRDALSRVSAIPPAIEFAVVDAEPSGRGAVEQSISLFRRSGPLSV